MSGRKTPSYLQELPKQQEETSGPYLEAGAGAGDAEGHGGAEADVGVVALRQQRHHAGTLLGGPDTHKARDRSMGKSGKTVVKT